MIIVNLAGILLIAFVVWWFWLYRAKQVSSDTGTIIIQVENGVYTPSRIQLPSDKPQQLRFERKDASPCAAMVIFPNLDIAEELPLNQITSISLPAMKKGEYPFHCQMQMYKGMLIVD